MPTRTRRRFLVGAAGVVGLAATSLACQGPATTDEATGTLRCQTYWGGDAVTEAGDHDLSVTLTAPAWTDPGEVLTLRVDQLAGYFGEPGSPYAMDVDLDYTGLDGVTHLDYDDPATGEPVADPSVAATVTGAAGTDATVDVTAVRFKKVGQWESARTVCFPRTGETFRVATIPIRTQRPR